MWKLYIKLVLAIILFLVSLYALYGVIASFVSMFNEIERLPNDQSASGMDFFLLEPMFIAFFSFIGLICSGINIKLCSYTAAKTVPLILFILFFAIIFVGLFMWIAV